MRQGGKKMTRAQARRLAREIRKEYPHSPVSSCYNFGRWFVSFGVDAIESAEQWKEYRRVLKEGEGNWDGKGE
jgi:hypothetical protein